MVSLPSTIDMLSAKGETKSKGLSITRPATQPAIMDSNGRLETIAVTNTNKVGSKDKAPQDWSGARLVDSQAKAR